MKQDNIIQLLLVNNSENDAVETSNLLRNEGLTLRPKIISNADLFDQEIKKKTYDIILFTANIDRLDILTALSKLKETHSDAAFIVIGNETPEESVSLMKQGASIVIPEEPEELITLTVKKEFAALKALRSEQILNKQLEDSEKRCQQLINSSHDAIAYVHEGMHILSNNPYYKMFGYESREDVEAMPIMDLVTSSDSASLKDFLRRYSQYDKIKANDNQDPQHNENILKVNGVKEDGSEFQMQMEFQPASMSGEKCIQIIIRNNGLSKNAQEKLQQKLAKLTTQDQETGLYNRRYFLEQLEITVGNAIDRDTKAYLLFITLDDFLHIREKLGVIISDQVISNIAKLIKNSTDEHTILARFESYRFSAILKSEDEQYALQLAENIRKAIDDHIADIRNKSFRTTCSIGVIQINSSSNGSQDNLTHVQNACNHAIKKGGNQISLYVPDASEMDNQQLIKFWTDEIEKAIKQKRLFLVFQPFINLLGEGSENFELFIRLRNEQGDILFPREFLAPAVADNYSIHIDRWIIAEAMRVLSERVKAGYSNRFIIKLSGASLGDDKFIAWVKHNLERYEIKGESVIFQVDAQLAAEHLRFVQQLTQQLHKLGCLLSLEHFGKEDNAFVLLKHIKVDFIKLDFELVKNISTDAKKLENLGRICTQANELGTKTIVAFVEEAGSLSAIWQSGAHYIQGIFLQEASESLDFDFSNFA
ncbi:MAG: EAL domain-containing protein [Gammaproteobacteria bacterium]|nr:EAL domain-containing protein [Gammaproteobacteria bacterium]